MIPLEAYLIVGALLLVIGLFGALTRRNALGILMSIELIINAANINLIAFARHIDPDGMAGQMFTLFVIAIAAAAAAVGLAIVISIRRSQRSVNLDKINLLKW